MSTKTIERFTNRAGGSVEGQWITAADLAKACKFSVLSASLDTIYVEDPQGRPATFVDIVETTLSDGSFVYNLVVGFGE